MSLFRSLLSSSLHSGRNALTRHPALLCPPALPTAPSPTLHHPLLQHHVRLSVPGRRLRHEVRAERHPLRTTRQGRPYPHPSPRCRRVRAGHLSEYFWAQTVKQAFAADLGDFNLKPIKAARQVKIVSGRRTRTKSFSVEIEDSIPIQENIYSPSRPRLLEGEGRQSRSLDTCPLRAEGQVPSLCARVGSGRAGGDNPKASPSVRVQ